MKIETFDMNIIVDIEFNEKHLTTDLMEAYEEHFHEVSNDSDFDDLETQLDKHKANITYALLRGHTSFIEGYGEVENFVKSYDVRLMNASKD